MVRGFAVLVLSGSSVMWTFADVPTTHMQDIVSYITSLGGAGVLALVSYLWITGKIVTRRELDASIQREEEWRNAALRSLANNERSVHQNEQVTSIVKEVVKGTTPMGVTRSDQ